jgi:hypothetical protein
MWQDFNLGRLDDADAGARTLIELARQLGTSLHLLDAITVRIGPVFRWLSVSLRRDHSK